MNSFGTLFKVQIFGESHGEAIGVVIDGLPAGLSLRKEEFSNDLARRKGGATGTTSRVEEEQIEFLSGLFNGTSTGTPLTAIVHNRNTTPLDYELHQSIPRPGHADFTAKIKHHGNNDYRGGGHHSGRLTIALIMAGVVAKKLLGAISIHSEILHIGGVKPWDSSLQKAMEEGDSLGGVIECRVKGLPVGIGEPFFNSIESMIAHIVFSIPGIRGIEFGDGFKAAEMKGSAHNDPIISSDGTTSRNGAGGINGGFSNGNELVFRTAIKPTCSIGKEQESYNFATGNIEKFTIKGRHDACFALRTPVVIEAATAIALADLLMQAPAAGVARE